MQNAVAQYTLCGTTTGMRNPMRRVNEEYDADACTNVLLLLLLLQADPDPSESCLG